MGGKKSEKLKRKLVRELKRNRRSPVWAYLKTKDRGMMRKRKRSWRFEKLGISRKRGKLKSEYSR